MHFILIDVIIIRTMISVKSNPGSLYPRTIYKITFTIQIINEIKEIIPKKLFLVSCFFIESIIIHIPTIKFKILAINVIKINILKYLSLIIRYSIIVIKLNNNIIARIIWQANLPLVGVFS